MNTTVLENKKYVTEVPPFSFAFSTNQTRKFHRDTLDEIRPKGLPIGPEVRFDVEEYDFDNLVSRLAEIERKRGLSSLEMFSHYVHGKLDMDEDTEEWLDLFILYLGTHEVRQFSCP